VVSKSGGTGIRRGPDHLGVMYYTGLGVPEDNILALMWLHLATLRYPPSEKESLEMAIRNRDFVASKMTPAQMPRRRS